jgi:hypothetical protein
MSRVVFGSLTELGLQSRTIGRSHQGHQIVHKVIEGQGELSGSRAL